MNYTYKPVYCAIKNLAECAEDGGPLVPALVVFDTPSRLADAALWFISVARSD